MTLPAFSDWIDERLLAHQRANHWYMGHPIKIYLRYGDRVLDGKFVKTIDLATVEILEKYRGNGFFTKYFRVLESKGKPIYVENVMEERFANFFRKNGYIEKPCIYGEIPCFYKLVSEKIVLPKEEIKQTGTSDLNRLFRKVSR